MIVRLATAADLDAIAALHVASWRSAYRGLLPDEFLDGPVEKDRTAHWNNALGEGDAQRVVLVVEDGDDMVGFASAEATGDDGFDAYIEHIHVSPDRTAEGIGRRLLAATAERLVAMGCGSAYLLVFTGNRQAIDFYERLGGTTIAFGLEDIAGIRIPRSRVAWADLSRLMAVCRTPR